MAETNELEAFCMTCPSERDVTRTLRTLGFDLTFQMPARIYPAYSATPPLPAQYHYSDAHGTEVIYLAGHDADLDGRRFPAHQSRFWLYPGSDPLATGRAMGLLAHTWAFTWYSPHTDTSRQHPA